MGITKPTIGTIIVPDITIRYISFSIKKLGNRNIKHTNILNIIKREITIYPISFFKKLF